MSEYRPAAQLLSLAGTYLFLAPALHSLPALASVTAGCPLRMREALRFVNDPVSSGTHERSQKAPGHSQSEALLAPAHRPGKKREGNSAEVGAGTFSGLWSSPALCPQSLVISCTVSAVSGHLLYCVRSLWSSLHCVRSLWSSPALCPQSLVISCTVSAVSGHLLHCVRSLWSSPALCPQSLVIPALCPQSLVISCTVSAVSGHLLHCVRSLWSSPVLCPQSLV
ncbi:unnamed protein product, partial [Staurois parvus]